MRIIARMNVGGPAIQVSELMRRLPAEQFDQLLVTGYCDESEVDFIDSQAPDVLAIRIAGLGRSISLLKDLTAFFSLVREIRRFQPDIIHTHTAKAGVLGRLASKVSGSKASMAHTFHGHLLHGYFSPVKTKLIIEAERLLARKTDKLVTVGTKVRDDLLAAGIGRPDQFEVIAPGLVPLELPDALFARSLLGLELDRPVVAFVGRVTRIKRPDRFLDMISLVKDKIPPTQFIVAGDGELLDSMQIEAKARELDVTFLGMRSDIENVYAASDVLVLSSDNEGTPLSLIQAGLAALPTIVTNVGSVSEVVISGQTGWIVDPTAEALAEALAEMLNDRDEADRRGRSAELHLSKRFGSKRFIDDYVRLYGNLHKRGRT